MKKSRHSGSKFVFSTKCNQLLMRARRWGTEIVTLYVGTDEQKFIAYKDVLCNKVPYFDKMFNGGFEEANTLIARFPEDDPKPFDLMLGWVYEGTLPK